jgi:hypothetical protein
MSVWAVKRRKVIANPKMNPITKSVTWTNHTKKQTIMSGLGSVLNSESPNNMLPEKYDSLRLQREVQ